MEILAPAKINLFLNVGEKRLDHFHEFQSIAVKVSLYDRITLSEDTGISIQAPDWIPDEENLAYRAALLLKEKSRSEKGCSIILEKNIPAGAGLGGGSSDAASVLKGLNKLWGLDYEIRELEKIGSKLGSDVNMFLHPGGCFAYGRGEKVSKLPYGRKKNHNIILIAPDINISTEKVYSKYTGGRLTPKDELDRIIRDYRQGDWSSILGNDLEKTVLSEYHILQDLKNRLINWGAHPLLSGSGSCIFALAEDKKLAESIKNMVEKSFNCRCWIVNEVN